MASNGVVHVVDSVMIPASFQSLIDSIMKAASEGEAEPTPEPEPETAANTHAAPVVVEASISVSGVTQAELVASPKKQNAFRSGFAAAVAVPATSVVIKKIGTKSMLSRRLQNDSSSSGGNSGGGDKKADSVSRIFALNCSLLTRYTRFNYCCLLLTTYDVLLTTCCL